MENKIIEKHHMTCLELGAILAFNILLFQPVLTQLSSYFSYFDEITALICFIAIIIGIAAGRAQFQKETKSIAIMLIALMVVGLICNYFSEVTDDYFSIFIDMFSCAKFFIVYIALKCFLSDTTHFVRYMSIESRFMLFGMLIALMVNQFYDIGMTFSTRYNLKSFEFIFTHPTHMVTVVLACFAYIYADGRKGWQKYLVIAVILMCSSLRFRWIALAVVMVLIVIFVRRGTTQAPITIIAIGTLASIFIGRTQLDVYYGSASETARNHLTSAAIDIMRQHFPLGTGFGTFGSGVTQTHYSPLYLQYGFTNVYGLTPNNPFFLTDTFWPVILAQFGVVGVIIWVIIFGIFIIDFYRVGQQHGTMVLALLFIATLLISTTASGSIFSVQMITLICAYMSSMHVKMVEQTEENDKDVLQEGFDNNESV